MNDFFEKFTKTIKNYNTIILATHKNMDLDGFSSCLCLFNIINKMKINCYIYLNREQQNKSINKTMDKLCKEKYYYNALYEDNLNDVDFNNSLLVIIDVHKQTMIENDKLLGMVNDTIVIDHHIKNDNYIKNTKLLYINSSLSSTAELFVNYSRYMNYTIDSLLATIMLAAIEIDTNGFNFKTSEHTYEAAAYLTKLGANPIIKKELLRESKDIYLKRQFYIEQSYLIDDNIMICEINDIVSSYELAVIADALLEFENVEASFCIGRLDEFTVGISARSIGNINVQEIMRKLGGGGHITEAATKMNDLSVEGCRINLLKVINGR